METINPFIVIEGMDGTGKTTVGKKLAERLGAQFMRTPGESYNCMRPYIDAHAAPEARLLFYLSSVVDASNRIEAILPTQPVVCDRYIWSSLVCHAAYFKQPLDKLEQTWGNLTNSLMQPTYTVLLDVNEEEQLRRMTGRSPTLTPNDKFCLNADARARLRHYFTHIAARDGWVHVDTTHKDVDAVIGEIEEQIRVGVFA